MDILKIEPEKLYRIEELVELTGYAKATLWGWCRNKKIEYKKIGRIYFISGKSFLEKLK